MQRPFILFICFFSACFIQPADSQAQLNLAQKADSLFNAKSYEQSAIMYEELIQKHQINRSNAFLKLAFISEQSGDFSRAIYYLSNYYSLNPTEEVFLKIRKLATENSYAGYNESDFNFFFLLFRKYFIWFLIVLVASAFYVLLIMFIKKNKGKTIPTIHKLSLLFLIGLGITLINVPAVFKQGIVNKHDIFLRAEPSSASEVSGNLPEGTRVNVIGQSDIWLKLLVNLDVQYARESDIWIIAKD